MEYTLLHKTAPFTRMAHRLRILNHSDDYWPRLKDVFIDVAGKEINLNECKTGLKVPETMADEPVIYKEGNIAVTYKSWTEYHVWIGKEVKS